MAPPAPDPANPNADPLNKSCSLCGRKRSAIATSVRPRGASEFFNPKKFPYYVCSHCDRDTLDGWEPGSVGEEPVPEDS